MLIIDILLFMLLVLSLSLYLNSIRHVICRYNFYVINLYKKI